MAPSDIFDLFESYPDRAYRLSLTSGEYVEVARAGDATIDGSMMFIPSRSGNRGINDKMKTVALVNIAMITPLERPGSASGN